MFISDEKLELIKEQTDLVSLIGSYVTLIKKGKNYIGLCPFHSEKTPSFTVNVNDNYFKCFGCGESGDAISFLEKYEGMDFIEAVKYLAERANIPLEDDDNKVRQKVDYANLYEINREAAIFFMSQLKKNKMALSYVKKRNISDESIIKFGLGYAPDSWDSLYNYLQKKGYSTKQMLEARLVAQSEKNSRIYDLYRSRLIFPIIDLKSRVVGFSGRIIGTGEPKYYNTADSNIFKKGNLLFGLNLVRKNRSKDRIILVEGNVDVVKLHQMGINYAVAPLGTAFTQRQAELLKRFGDEVYLCLDGDEAGQKATIKDIGILKAVGVEPKVVSIKAGIDPDEYIDKYGVAAFENLIINSMNSFDYQIECFKKGLDLSKRDDFILFTREIITLIKQIPSNVEKQIYIEDVSKRFGLSKELLESELIKDEVKFNRPSVGDYTIPKASFKLERMLFALCLSEKANAVEAELYGIINYLSNEEDKKILQEIFNEYESKEKIEIDEFKKILENKHIKTNLIVSLQNTPAYAKEASTSLKDILSGIRASFLAEERKEIKEQIDIYYKKNDINKVNELLRQMDSLNEMEGV